ncbi:thioredoxin reductase [Pochonia chlamydosporia 170]|uniref:Thioredoxin reductase n=1 Tax=Pochonia chlamydosporia 170 TaxID=1380566 RepID=A0A179F2A7_METCM|nr:thioredoxin reductase [Pochonia chlamydosporia 170]OAQ59440.1 thioredoxin reductase [Pochonia chlamydosporia 170]
MATPVSLHNQHFWIPSTHVHMNYSGRKRLSSAQQQSSSSLDIAGKPLRKPSSRSSSHVVDDQTAKTDEIISIPSDEESDVEGDSHHNESRERATHMSSTQASTLRQGSMMTVCTKSPRILAWDESTGAIDNHEASADAVFLERSTDTAHALPSPRARSVVRDEDADCEQRASSVRQSSAVLDYTPRQIEKASTNVSLSNTADNSKHAHPDDTLPLVEALAASAKEQIGDTRHVGEHNRQSNRDDGYEGAGAPSSPSAAAYQEVPRGPSPVSAQSTTSSAASPFHSPLTPGSTRASTPAVSRQVNMSLKNLSCDLDPMQTSSSREATEDIVNTLGDPPPVQPQLPDSFNAESNIYVQINDKNMETRSSKPPSYRRIRPTTMNEKSQWRDRDDPHRQDGVRRQSDTEYCPSSTDDENEDDDRQDSDDDEVIQQHSRKRRRFGSPSIGPRMPSKRHCPDTSTRERRPRDMLLSAISHPSTDGIDGVRAEFEEWALENVRLKRTIVNDRATFQLQFDWDLCMKHGYAVHPGSKRSQKRGGHSTRARFTPEEDCLLKSLKEELELSWADIHAQFSAKFGWRSKEALQVRYCTKLKFRG